MGASSAGWGRIARLITVSRAQQCDSSGRNAWACFTARNGVNPQTHMRVSDLQRLYAYSRWATERLLSAAAELSDENLHRAIGGSFSSIHDTLDHLRGVERLWLDRWLGRSPAALSSVGPAGGVAAFTTAWRPVWEGQAVFLASLSDESLNGTFEYRNQSGKTASVGTLDMLIHVANHATYHRGQIASQIRQLGGIPAPTDFLLFSKDPSGTA
jgi:uncharacterized damage-inducible protein DinB